MDGDAESVDDVLVVDDNPGDRRFVREAFKASKLDLTVHTVNTRTEALDLIHQREEYADGPTPDVILLDWNLSHTTSEEVLTAAKAGESSVFVIVMTSSTANVNDLQSTYTEADMVIEKPTDPEGYISTLGVVQSEK